MPSILEDFARGNMLTKPPLDPNSELADTIEFASNLKKELLDRLSGEDKALFEKIINANLEIIELTAVENRIHGYRQGFIMTAETFITWQGL